MSEKKAKKMGREEVIERLNSWYYYCFHACESDMVLCRGNNKKCQQAYEQIKEILEQYELIEKDIECLKEIKIFEYERGLSDAHKALEQKPRVDEEFVEKWVDKLGIKVRQRWSDDYYVNPSKEDLKQLLKEAGVEIINPPEKRKC